MGVITLPLASCGWWDGSFAPYYAYPNSPSLGAGYYGATQHAAPGRRDRNRPKGMVSLEGGAGVDFITGGDLIRGGQQSIAMKDAFGNGTRYDASATIPVANNRYFTGTAYRASYNGRDAVVTVQNSAPIAGRVSDYRAHGAEFGIRQYAPSRRYAVQPFAEGRIGGAYVDGISINQGASNIPLSNSGWVPTGAAIIGFETPTSSRFTAGVETGLRYQGRLSTAPGFRPSGAGGLSGSLITCLLYTSPSPRD